MLQTCHRLISQNVIGQEERLHKCGKSRTLAASIYTSGRCAPEHHGLAGSDTSAGVVESCAGMDERRGFEESSDKKNRREPATKFEQYTKRKGVTPRKKSPERRRRRSKRQSVLHRCEMAERGRFYSAGFSFLESSTLEQHKGRKPDFRRTLSIRNSGKGL